MTKFAANLSFMFTEVDFLDRFEAAAKAGSRSCRRKPEMLSETGSLVRTERCSSSVRSSSRSK